MFLRPKNVQDHGVRTVSGVEVQVVELIWPDNSSSFEIWHDDVDLTIGSCYSKMPNDAQIEGLIKLFKLSLN